MRPYIYGKRNLIHIIDLRETVRGLIRASRFLTRIAAQGSLILFVGTKRQAQDAVLREAKRCFMPYVSERWIGGTFTNFRVVRNRLQRLDELENLIRTGEIEAYSKKRRATLLRELRKVHRNLSGIRTMNRLPGAMVIVDCKREASAVKEARKVGIPTIALIDTDSDPDLIDLAIPGNDDSIRSVDLVLTALGDAVREGYGALPRDQAEKLEAEYTKAHPAEGLVIPASLTSAAASEAEVAAAEPTTSPEPNVSAAPASSEVGVAGA
jgi:small subunit ribosomal protein S2